MLIHLLFAGAVAAQTPAPAVPDPPASAAGQAAAGGVDDLSSQATDPTASLMAFNLIGDWKLDYWDREASGFELRFQPVVPFRAWGLDNILRVVVPYQDSGTGADGLQSVSIFDLIVLQRKWGRFGFGPVMSLASSTSGAPSNFAAGPAVGAVLPLSKKLNVGLFSQNLFANDVATSQLQPIVAFQLGHGWSLSAGDLQFVYDWESSRWVSVPVGFQIGVVRSLAGQPMRFALNPQWNLEDIAGAEKSKLVFTVTVLAPSR